MSTPLNPQEIFLIERYTSDDYFWHMRESWASMVKHAERCLEIFVNHLPPDYRNRQMPSQHDIVWGERILPNFQDGLDGLNRCWIKLSRGDKLGLAGTGCVLGNAAGYRRDYNLDLMNETSVVAEIPDAEAIFLQHMDAAVQRAGNTDACIQGAWTIGDLTTKIGAPSRGPLNPPLTWPIYRLNSQVRIKTDDAVKVSGIYLPDASESAPQYMIAGWEGMNAHSARVGYNPETMWEREQVPTTWTLVERIADSGGGTPGDPDPIKAGIRLRAEANQPCPKSGYWFTPAHLDSRRLFQQGEVMPDAGGSYGATIWQWDEQQS